MTRVSSRMQRQLALRGVAALAVAAVVGMGAAGTVQRIQNANGEGRGDETTVSTQPGHEKGHEPSSEPSHDSSAPSSEAPAATPHSEPTTAPGGDAPSTSGSGSEAGASTGHEANHEPASSPSPENTAASGPLAVTAFMDPATIDAGSTATAVVTARDGEGRLLSVDIDWGDGTTPFHFAPGATACPRMTHLDGRFSHTYATGRSTPYPVHVTITTGDCAETETKTVETHVTVRAPEPTSSPSPTQTNGPDQPTPGATQVTGDNPSYVYVQASGSDSDGFVRRIYVDWGDGSGSLVGEWATSSCTIADGTTHPTATSRSGKVNHHYSSAGDHTITVKVQSVACDGSSVQNGAAQFTVNQAA